MKSGRGRKEQMYDKDSAEDKMETPNNSGKHRWQEMDGKKGNWIELHGKVRDK
jgi:hypothetical protein